ncbi:MAG: PASTA domain-containing protein [Ruminococcaceae bacterium]|nr:PASTA domain-containing protein [Oscillospiraceae bacterium]
MKKTNLFRLLALVLAAVFCLGGLCLPAEKASVAVAAATNEGSFTVPSRCPYTLDGEYLKGIEVNTTVGELLYYFTGKEAVVKNANGTTVTDNAKLASGYTITVDGATVTLVVVGDADGDGVSNSADVEIAKSILVNSADTAAYAGIVAELTGDGVISSADYLALKYLKECQLLVQSAPSTARVPNLSGMTEAEAKTALEEAGFVADVRYTSVGTKGQVAYQKVEAGFVAGEGAKISFVVTSDGRYSPLNYDRVKGIWLYQYTSSTSLFKYGTNQRDEASYRTLVERVINNMSRDGFNTVYLQMRPYGDALYPSEVYPPSPYVCSGSTYNGSFTYDPLEIFLEIAHASDISVQAWLNPMRLMTTGALAGVDSKYRLRQWYNDSTKNGTYIVANSGRYYLNPAYPETRQLVVDGIMEICENYDIDGIHFDDYFYISIDSTSTDLAFDQDAFNKYGASYGSSSSLSVRKEFRRQQVNTLLREIYGSIKDYNEDIIFGISPAGNIDNNQTGYLCADIKTWCSTPGYVDYICPQVYWSFNHSWDQARFDICTNNWAALCTAPEVDLIIGMATYQGTNSASSSGSDPGWGQSKDNIARMLTFLKTHSRASGWIFFKYESTYNILSDGYSSECSQEINNYIGMIKDW